MDEAMTETYATKGQIDRLTTQLKAISKLVVALRQEVDDLKPKPATPPKPTPCRKAFVEASTDGPPWEEWSNFRNGFNAGVKASAKRDRDRGFTIHATEMEEALLDPPERKCDE